MQVEKLGRGGGWVNSGKMAVEQVNGLVRWLTGGEGTVGRD